MTDSQKIIISKLNLISIKLASLHAELEAELKKGVYYE